MEIGRGPVGAAERALGIFLMNLDAAREVYAAARDERRAVPAEA